MKKFIFIITAIFIFSYSGYAQFGSGGAVDARSLGMAKTYNVSSNGVYSIGTNPANLVNSERWFLDISTLLPLPFIAIRSGTDFISIDEIDYYFGGVDGRGRYLTEEDKSNLKDLFKDGGFVFMNGSARLFSISYNAGDDIGAFAFSINDFAGGKFNFPEALVDLAFTGNLRGEIYDLSDAEIKSWWIRDYSLSYAKDFQVIGSNLFKSIGAGISLKLVNGYYFAGTEEVNTFINTGSQNQLTGNAQLLAYSAFSEDFGVKYDFDSTDHDSNVGLFPSSAGNGFGIDLGVNAKINDNWMVALSVTDIGGINWTENAAEFTASGDIYLDDITDQDQLDSLKEKVFGDGKGISEFSTGLPTALRMGVSCYLFSGEDDIPGTLLLALDYNQGFNNLPGNSTDPRISLGAEWKPTDWVPFLRTGFSFGGAEGFNWAFGLGIDADILEFHIATADLQSIVAPNSAKKISVAIGSRWKFD